MAPPNIPTGSLLMDLHARYEATQAEYAVVERAETDFNRQSQGKDAQLAAERCRAACLTLEREADALRDAILYQVPDSWSEALILQFHIACAHDMYAAASKPSEGNSERLQLALDTLFDFMCCEMPTGVEAMGAALKDVAQCAYRVRRLRTGVVEA